MVQQKNIKLLRLVIYWLKKTLHIRKFGDLDFLFFKEMNSVIVKNKLYFKIHYKTLFK